MADAANRPGDYELVREQWIEAPLGPVFAFFSDPHNLESLTPGWLRFRILDAGGGPVEQGRRIVYRIWLVGVPVRWTTRIRVWEPGRRFVDVQQRGPFALWEHTHEFRQQGGGVVMTDRVRYRPPLGWLGRVTHFLWIRAALARIFDYRFEVIRRAFAPDD